MDVFIVTSLIEPPLLHLPYPSVAQAQAEIAACNDGTMPLEPYQLISQYTLEPLLKSVAETLPSVSVRYGCEFISFAQDAKSVRAEVRRSDGSTAQLEANYLVGCDGGASSVRRQLGIKLQGEANLLELRQALYRCDDLFERIPIGKGRHYHVADAHSTFLIVQDSTRHFTLHSVVDSDADMATMFEATVAMPVEYEMLYVGKWRQNLLLADSYGQRPRFPRRRRRASGDPDRRARHEQRRRRRRRSVVEAGGDAARLGRPRSARLLRDRAPADRRPQRRRLAPCLARPARLARGLSAEYPRQHAGRRRDARQPHPHRRRGTAQEQRDDRRRARLPLCRLADHLAGARRRPGAQFHEIRADELAGRAPAASLARRRHGAARPHRRRLYAAASCRHANRRRRAGQGVRRLWRAVHRARHR